MGRWCCSNQVKSSIHTEILNLKDVREMCLFFHFVWQNGIKKIELFVKHELPLFMQCVLGQVCRGTFCSSCSASKAV